MNNSNRQEKYNATVENNQLVLMLNSEILLPEDAPVRVTSAHLEKLDYRKLYAVYSSKGRKSVTDPRVLFKVWHTDANAASIPAASWNRLVSTVLTSCSFSKMERPRIILPFPGFRQADAAKQFLALGFNLKKRWMKQQKGRLKTHYSEKKAV